MSILVTGATGGLGKLFVPILRTKYSESIISTGRHRIQYPDYYACDLTQASSVENLIKSVRPRLIFHLAGSFTGQFDNDFKVNTLGAKHLFDSLISERVSARVVILGSAAEYGVVLPQENPVSESVTCKPVTIYGLTKNYQTELAKYYVRSFNLDIVIARVFNLAIAGLSTQLFYGRAEAMIKAYQSKEISHLQFGNLASERDYIDIELAAAQLLTIAEFGTSGEIYNVGSGFPKKMKAILIEMLSKEGIFGNVFTETSSEVVGRKGFDVPRIYADITKVTAISRTANRTLAI